MCLHLLYCISSLSIAFSAILFSVFEKVLHGWRTSLRLVMRSTEMIHSVLHCMVISKRLVQRNPQNPKFTKMTIYYCAIALLLYAKLFINSSKCVYKFILCFFFLYFITAYFVLCSILMPLSSCMSVLNQQLKLLSPRQIACVCKPICH